MLWLPRASTPSRVACTLIGGFQKRATPIERMLVRVCREGGARVRYNAFFRDMNVGVRASDERRIEVFASLVSEGLRWPLTSH